MGGGTIYICTAFDMLCINETLCGVCSLYTSQRVSHSTDAGVGGGTRIIPWIRGRFRRASDSITHFHTCKANLDKHSSAGSLATFRSGRPGRPWLVDDKSWLSGIVQSPTDLQTNLPVVPPPGDPEACRLMIQYRALPWLWWSAQKLELTHPPLVLAGAYYVPSVMLIE